jgi:hypothetical protein
MLGSPPPAPKPDRCKRVKGCHGLSAVIQLNFNRHDLSRGVQFQIRAGGDETDGGNSGRDRLDEELARLVADEDLLDFE